MGEMEFEQNTLAKAVNTAMQETAQAAAALHVATPGGRFHVRWDEGGSATALGQLPFFTEFLEVSGLFARWVDGCPMAYTSPNAPDVVDVLGTWLLSILDGQRRYAHVTLTVIAVAATPDDERNYRVEGGRLRSRNFLAA